MRFALPGYRLEAAALVFIGLTMLAIVKPSNVQDHSRLALSEAILRNGSVQIDPWIRAAGDHAQYGGHFYSDKAPGLSFFALPEVAASIAVPGAQPWLGTWRRWLMRLFINGPLLLGLCALLGRLAEGAVRGTGAAVAVTAGVGTLLGPVSSILFEHVGAAFFAFAAFVLVGRRRLFSGGLMAGIGVLWEYQVAIAAAIIGVYALARGAAGAGRYLLGLIPAAVVLGVYDVVAFGSPFRLSYRYVDNGFTGYQAHGFFGVGLPTVTGFHIVLLGGTGFRPGDWGLLSQSPVLAAAALGLLLLWRRGARLEAALCAVVAAAFIAWDAGYFAPYGGQSPGARFAVVGLPFLLVGLPYAFRSFPLPTIVLMLLSLALSTAGALAWGLNGTLWLSSLPASLWSLSGTSRTTGVAICSATAAVAAVIAVLPLVRMRGFYKVYARSA